MRSRTHIAPAVATLSFCNSTFSIARTLVSGVVVPGHASMLLCFGGPQSIGLGVVEYVARIDGEGRKRPVDQVKRRDPARQACASGRQTYSHTSPDVSIVMLEVGWTRFPWEPKDRAGHQSTTPRKRFPLHCSGGNVR
uniref:Secreted protein n=1 Tax=Ralstonia solanacearum TaxID=305 RepID=A0A0S4UDM0_RALSL|nr:exported protein of unknown function [Ralstonia solanacearum]